MIGERTPQHVELLRDASRHLRQQRLDLRGHVGAHEEPALVGVPVVAVEVHHLDARHGNPRAAHDVGLHRDVGQVIVLHLAAGLHLDQRPVRAAALQHVHSAEDTVFLEARLEEHVSAGLDRGSRTRDARTVTVVALDQHAVGPLVARPLADQPALVEEILEHYVGLEFRGVRFVHGPPEELGALPPVHEPGLGEVMPVGLGHDRESGTGT